MRRLPRILALLAVLAGGLATPAAAAPAPTLTFATFNVCKSECAPPAPAWSVRRDRVANVIEASGADVIGLQEATNWPVGTQTSTAAGRERSVSLPQWQDIANLSAPAGYVAPVQDGPRCRVDFACTHTARLMFNGRTVQQADVSGSSAGDATLGEIARTGTAADSRQVAWAYLQGRNGAGPFLALSAHLETAKTAAGEASRVAFGRGLDAWVVRMNAERGVPGLPVVLMGDFNSYDARQPHGIQRVLRDAGWQDAWNAPSRTNIGINSVNYSPTSRSGWPVRPIRNPSGVASRIDYIVFRGAGLSATRYEVMARLDAAGRYLEPYRASDHNLLRAAIAFG